MPNPAFSHLPKVGIRPTIDGRLGGVRESLEAQTMDMAKATAKLLKSRAKALLKVIERVEVLLL